MPDDIVIDDDLANRHIENLEAIYKAGLDEAEQVAKEQRAKGHVVLNLAVKRIALRCTLQAYTEKLEEIGDDLFSLTGHHVMARWSREKIEGHS